MARSIHQPGGVTALFCEVKPGLLFLSTHSGVSKKDPFGPVPANPGHSVNMCFIKCGAQSLGAVLEGQKVMYLSHGRVPYQTALFNDTILLHILCGSQVHILNKN